MKSLKITCISDTHNKHEQIPLKYLSGGDILIHAGDVSSRGYLQEIIPFLEWYNNLPYTHKILIAGNHDFYFEDAKKSEVDELMSQYPNITYLNDSGVEIEGLKIWGSPIQPYFHNWAFNRKEDEIKKHWDIIPTDTQILIVHGGPKSIANLNKTIRGEDVGCAYLFDKLSELKSLNLFVQGHIHEGRGFFKYYEGPLMVNASVLNLSYVMSNKPYVIDTDGWNIIDY